MIALQVIQPNGKITIGIHARFEKIALCADCNKVHEFECCPLCGSYIDLGYGLAFGGYGFYKSCKSNSCTWFYKELALIDEC